MTVTSGQTLDIGFNQIDSGDVVDAGGTLNVLFGGTALNTDVFGIEDIFSGGTAINTFVLSGGIETVNFGGTAVNTFVTPGVSFS